VYKKIPITDNPGRGCFSKIGKSWEFGVWSWQLFEFDFDVVEVFG
jgi:hypothetical protein